MTTTPTFRATDETACDTDRALTSEHGRRLVQNALACWNERVGHIGHAELLVGDEGQDLTTRRVVSAGWAYLGPWLYYCRQPTGQPNGSRAVGSIRLMLSGRCSTTGGSVYLFGLNENVGSPTEDVMDSIIRIGDQTDRWFSTETQTIWEGDITIPVVPGKNRIWLAVKCDAVGEPVELTDPYLAEVAAGWTTGSSHPSVFASGDDLRYAPALGVQLAASAADYNAGQFDTYTVPMTIGGNASQYLLWEPFRTTLSRIAPVLYGDVFAGASPSTQGTVVAYLTELAALDIDSIYVDASQVFVLEDYQFGAGLRWWQLPSASQYRSAAELVAVARRAVVPQVSMVGEVLRGTVAVPYPPGDLSGKPRVWAVDDGSGIRGLHLLRLLEALPFALPTTQVQIVVWFPVCAMLLRQRRNLSSVVVNVTPFLFNRATSTTVATGDVQSFTLALLPNGGLDGSSVLARTLGWSTAYTNNANTAYGGEGLTLRQDWGSWQDLQVRMTVDASLITTDPIVVRLLVAIDDSEPEDFYVAVGDIAIYLEGY